MLRATKIRKDSFGEFTGFQRRSEKTSLDSQFLAAHYFGCALSVLNGGARLETHQPESEKTVNVLHFSLGGLFLIVHYPSVLFQFLNGGAHCNPPERNN